ncbi:MAG: fimbria/pilus outer membrane usher protein, partial [Nitrospinota bacterium]
MKLFQRVFTRSLAVILFPIALFPAFSSGSESNTEIIILKVFLNTADKGDFFLNLTNEGDIFISREDLKKIGFHELPQENQKNRDGHVSLTSLSPRVIFTLNEAESALNLTVDPDLLETHVVDLTPQKNKDVSPVETNSLYLNYQLNFNTTPQNNFDSFSVPFETGLRIGQLLFYSNFNYVKNTAGENKVTRLFTNFTTDSTSSLKRIILGDFTASSETGVGDSGILGGISVSKNYSLSPYFIKVPRLQLSGILETPSEVLIYVNDTLVVSEFLQPGKFEFLNLPTNSAGGKTLLVTRDAYGKEERTETPFVLSANILKPGIHEYSYNLGFVRNGFGTESQDYGDLSYMFFHRVGVTRYFTAGFRGEGDSSRWNFGPAINLLLGRLGQVNSSVAFSSTQGKQGHGSTFHFSTSVWRFFVQFSFGSFSKGYSNLFIEPETGTKFSSVGTVGFSSRLLGSLSASVSTLKPHQGLQTKEENLSYNRFLSKHLSLFINARRVEKPFREDVVLIGLNFFSGSSTSGNLEYQRRKESDQMSFYIQKNPKDELGTTYRLRGIKTRFKDFKDQDVIDAGIRHQGNFGNLSVDYTRNGNINTYFLKYAGSLSLLDRSFYISRPIYDSFALVDVGELEGVEVFYENRSIGKTGSYGTIVIPGVPSYSPVRININPDDVPLEYSLPKTEEYVMLPYKSGAVIKFPAMKLLSFEGKIALIKDGKKRYAEFGGLDIEVGKEKKEIMVGKEGMFYFENIPPGRF